jgi:NAD-dependent dihydropyrimidine dehydrogenase PreA subunit
VDHPRAASNEPTLDGISAPRRIVAVDQAVCVWCIQAPVYGSVWWTQPDHAHLPADSSRCSSCGSCEDLAYFYIEEVDEFEAYGYVKSPGFATSGRGHKVIEFRIGSRSRSADGASVRIDRLVDRTANRYHELVLRHDGTVLRHADEPLSEHRGRGAARVPRQPGPASP